MAIIQALIWVEEEQPWAGCYLLMLCSLMALGEGKLGVRSDLKVHVLVHVYKIDNAEGKVGFFGVPAHVGWREVADRVTRRTLNREVDVEMVIGVQEDRAVTRIIRTAGWKEQWGKEKKARYYFSLQNSVNVQR